MPSEKAIEAQEPPPCHSDSDGDCDWKDCPQKKVYRIICPLYKAYADYWQERGYDMRF